MNIHFFQYLEIFQQKLMILPQNISITPHGPKCKHGSFCSIFRKLSEYFNLEIALWGKQGLLVIQKPTIYRQQFHKFSLKISGFLPQNDQ
jgi:hypothetical protein